jgi:hypothetical protein
MTNSSAAGEESDSPSPSASARDRPDELRTTVAPTLTLTDVSGVRTRFEGWIWPYLDRLHFLVESQRHNG